MNKKILVVDDDVDIIEPICLLLAEEGYSVDGTTKGEQSFKKIQEFHPDLILLDILMSGSDGRIICKDLKTNQKTKNIPIVLMSAHPGVGDDVKACQANDFIAKPFETDDLLHVVQKNLQNNGI